MFKYIASMNYFIAICQSNLFEFFGYNVISVAVSEHMDIAHTTYIDTVTGNIHNMEYRINGKKLEIINLAYVDVLTDGLNQTYRYLLKEKLTNSVDAQNNKRNIQLLICVAKYIYNNKFTPYCLDHLDSKASRSELDQLVDSVSNVLKRNRHLLTKQHNGLE